MHGCAPRDTSSMKNNYPVNKYFHSCPQTESLRCTAIVDSIRPLCMAGSFSNVNVIIAAVSFLFVVTLVSVHSVRQMITTSR